MHAYGDVLAPMIGATLTKFACTGSTYDNGITFDRRYGDVLYRPAQFGNWLGMTNLNAAYDAAMPDVVIITLGADDVSFADIFTFCMVGHHGCRGGGCARQCAGPIAPASRQVPEAIPDHRSVAESPAACDVVVVLHGGQSGLSVLNLFWDPINSGQIAGNDRSLVAAIKARGEKAGKVPQIIFTTYHQPLPGPTQSDRCEDLGNTFSMTRSIT